MHLDQNKEVIEDGGDIESEDDINEFPTGLGRKYSPVVAHDVNDRAVVEITSIHPGSSSSFPRHELKKVKVGVQPNMASEEREESLANHSINGPQRESKLELFGFDSLVNILGLKSMTGDQALAPSSPRDGEDVTITFEQPKNLLLLLWCFMQPYLWRLS